jgi:hypothetical protein
MRQMLLMESSAYEAGKYRGRFDAAISKHAST